MYKYTHTNTHAHIHNIHTNTRTYAHAHMNVYFERKKTLRGLISRGLCDLCTGVAPRAYTVKQTHTHKLTQNKQNTPTHLQKRAHTRTCSYED